MDFVDNEGLVSRQDWLEAVNKVLGDSDFDQEIQVFGSRQSQSLSTFGILMNSTSSSGPPQSSKALVSGPACPKITPIVFVACHL